MDIKKVEMLTPQVCRLVEEYLRSKKAIRSNEIPIIKISVVRQLDCNKLDLVFSYSVSRLNFKGSEQACTRVKNALNNARVKTVGQIARTLTRGELLKFRDFAKLSLNILESALALLPGEFSVGSHLGCLAGPKETEALKCLDILGLRFLPFDISASLRDAGFEFVQHLFPRSKFEQDLRNSDLKTSADEIIIGVSKALRMNGMIW